MAAADAFGLVGFDAVPPVPAFNIQFALRSPSARLAFGTRAPPLSSSYLPEVDGELCRFAAARCRKSAERYQQFILPLRRLHERAGLVSRLVLIAAGVGLLNGCGHRDAIVDNWIEPITGMEFIRIEAGEFKMGLRADEPGDLRTAPLHSVLIPDAFYLGRFEVTQAQWTQVMGTHPSHFSKCGEGCPVENVSWHEVQDFLRRLDESNSGWHFRLPTEAEWEYACRAGGDRPYGAMEQLDPSLANFDSRIPFDGIVDSVFRGGPTRVGSFPSSPLGLHDMQGNVWEWVQDEFCPYPEGPAVAPVGKCVTDSIPIRGGSWYFSANAARCGRRYVHHRDDRGFSLGFRVLAMKSLVSGDG